MISKNEIRRRIVEALRKNPHMLYLDLRFVVFPWGKELSEPAEHAFIDVINEMKAAGEIRWASGEIDAIALRDFPQPEAAAFEGAPETATQNRRPKLRERLRR